MIRSLDRCVWTSAALLSALILPSIFHQPVGWIPPAVVTALAVLAAVRPYDALLIVAGLGPLAGVIFVVLRTGTPAHIFSKRWRSPSSPALRSGAFSGLGRPRCVRRLYVSVILLLTLVLASAAFSAAVMVAEEPGWTPVTLLRSLTVEDYLVLSNPITAAGLFAEGLLLLLAVSDLCGEAPGRRRDVARMLVIAAAAAAFSTSCVSPQWRSPARIHGAHFSASWPACASTSISAT